jgi:NADH:ubiquinone oxidoreductase subunit K
VENKIFKGLVWLCTFGIIFLGAFIIFIANYGLMPKNTFIVIIESIGVMIAADIFNYAVTSFYDYCDEIEEAEKEEEE